MIKIKYFWILVLLFNLSIAYAAPSDEDRKGVEVSDQHKVHWLVDYIMMASGLPKEEAIQSLNRTQEVFDGFQGKTKTEFGVFLLNQKELKPLLSERVIRDVLFMWTVEILKERPLSETNSQKLLIYWAAATQQYATGTEYEERLHALLSALGDALPSVPAMVDWYEALEVIVQEKREGSDLALKKYLHVLHDNWILNMVIAQNAYNILPQKWCETLDKQHLFPMTPLEMIYLSSECWKESTDIAKAALFKTPDGVPADQVDLKLQEISKRGEHPLFYLRDAHHKYRLLLLKSIVKDVLSLHPEDIRFSPEDEILLKQMSIGLSQDVSLEDMSDVDVSKIVHEFMAAYQHGQANQRELIEPQLEMKRKLALLWFVRFSPLLSQETWTDDERLFIEEVLIRQDNKIHPLIALSFKHILSSDQWNRIKFEVYNELLSETEFENIYFRMAVIHNVILKLNDPTATPEDHLEGYLLGNYLRRAFQKDTREFQYPLIVTHEKNPVPMIYLNHYEELHMLQDNIAPDFLSQGVVTLPEEYVQILAPDLMRYMKAKLAMENKMELTDQEKQELTEQYLLFENQSEITSKTLVESHIPHVYSAMYSVGRVIEEDGFISDYKKILPPIVDIYKEQETLLPAAYDLASHALLDSLSSMENKDFEKAHLKTYFTQWFPEHIQKGNRESQQALIQDLTNLIDPAPRYSEQREESQTLDPIESKKLQMNRLDYVIHMLSALPHAGHEDGHHYEAFIKATNLFSASIEDLEGHDMRKALVNLYSAFIDGFDLQSRNKIFIGDVHKARKAFFKLLDIAYFMNPIPLDEMTLSEDERVDLAVKTQWWLKSYLTSYLPETGPAMGKLNGISFSCDNADCFKENSSPLTEDLAQITEELDRAGEVLPPLEYRDQNFVYCMLVSRFVQRIFGQYADKSTDELESMLTEALDRHSEQREESQQSAQVLLFKGFIEYIKTGALLNLYQGLRNLIQIVGLDSRDVPLYFVIQKIHDHEPQIENFPEYNETEYMGSICNGEKK